MKKKSTQIKGTQNQNLKSYAIKDFKLLIRTCLWILSARITVINWVIPERSKSA